MEKGREVGRLQGMELARTELAREQLRLLLNARFPRLSPLIAVEGLEADQAIALFRVALTATTDQELLAAL